MLNVILVLSMIGNLIAGFFFISTLESLFGKARRN